MTPVEPADDGRRRVTYAAKQSEYLPLPSTVGAEPECEVTTEWELSEDERTLLARGGRVQLKLWTFGDPLQPVLLSVVEARKA